ncbi:MAG: DUF72 domain-containing protein [Chitinophagaceae bacterium]|nr:DUF72 domain-containing protein [Chitinophagaceae bacterium]
MIETWIGCSGFHYKEWKEIFYPAGLPQNRWFEYYSRQFNTLELNTTFYRFPRLSFLQNWYNKSPELYRFSAKAPRLITHYKQFNDSKRMLSDFYGTCREGLGNKLGCILFQLPDRIRFSDEMLDRIIEHMDPAFTNVIEFRHAAWWQNKVYRKLAMHGIHFCSISYPGLPEKLVQSSSLVYYRFHGIPRLYKSCYKKHTVINMGEQLLKNKKNQQAFIYFNNTWGTGALRNARQLLSYLHRSQNKN